MNNEEKQEIEWATKRIDEVQAIAKTPLGGAIMLAVEKHLREKMPKLMPDFNAEMDIARRDRDVRMKTKMEKEGPKIWAILHLRTDSAVTNEEKETAWLQGVLQLLPCGECRQFAIEYMVSHRPTFRNYPEWMVGFHNAVNAKLGKKTVTLAEAKVIWAK